MDVGDARRNEREKTLVTRGWVGPGYWPPQTVVRDVPVVQSTLCVFFKDAATECPGLPGHGESPRRGFILAGGDVVPDLRRLRAVPGGGERPAKAGDIAAGPG